MLSPNLFPSATCCNGDLSRVSDDAWTLACNASFQNTWWRVTCEQDDVLSILEDGATVVVTFGRFDGSVYQETHTLNR